MKNLLVLIILMMTVSSALANSAFSQASIQRLVVHDFGDRIVITLNNYVSNNEKCTINNQLVLEKSNALFKESYAALLSAFYTDTLIEGWVNGCHSMGMPKLTRIDLVR